jgi:hypothetical protein
MDAARKSVGADLGMCLARKRVAMRSLGVMGWVLLALAGIGEAALGSSSAAASVIRRGGVEVKAPGAWRLIMPAGEASFTDPKTVLVAGSPGVTASLTSSCQVAAYRLPADGAVVVIVRWRTVTSGGGRPPTGRAPLKSLTRVSRPSFECFNGRGAAAQLALRGHAYQVNVMVGDRASIRRIEQALAVARSFNLAR